MAGRKNFTMPEPEMGHPLFLGGKVRNALLVEVRDVSSAQ